MAESLGSPALPPNKITQESDMPGTPGISDAQIWRSQMKVLNGKTASVRGPDGTLHRLDDEEEFQIEYDRPNNYYAAVAVGSNGKRILGEGPLLKNMPSKAPLSEESSLTPPQSQEQISALQQSDVVFEDVYKTIFHYLEVWNAKETFNSKVKESVAEYIDPYEDQAIEDSYTELQRHMEAHIAKYKGKQGHEQIEAHYLQRFGVFTKHIDSLVASGAVDKRTARLFINRFRDIPKGKLNLYYDPITSTYIESAKIPSSQWQRLEGEYDSAVKDLFNKTPENLRRHAHGWYHFNNSMVQGENIRTRIYVSANFESPAKVIEAWQSALEEVGMQNKTYFKMPPQLEERYESFVVYLDQEGEKNISKILEAFERKCPPELLRDVMPSTTRLARGIFMAFEPRNINQLSHSLGEGNISYNQLISALMELSLELASKSRQGKITDREAMKSVAKEYFKQLVHLCGVNPETMVPNAQGGQLPGWAKALMEKRDQS